MHNYGFYLENAWGKPRTGGPQQAGEATVKPRGEQSEGVWEIDKKYSDLETLYAQRHLSGLTWHVGGQEVFVPLSSAGEVGSKEPFVFSVALPANDGSNYSYFHTFTLESDETFTYTQEKIAGGVETAFLVVDIAPDGKPDVSDPSTQLIYLTREPDSPATDPYTEWIYTADGQWEIIGETSLDLSGYSTTEQIAENYYNKGEINNTVETINQTISDVSGDATEAIEGLRSDKANKAVPQASGNLASLDGTGDLADSGAKVTSTYNGSDSVNPVTGSAVKSAISDTLAGLDAEVTSDDGTNVQVKVTEVDGKVTAVSVTDDTVNSTDVSNAVTDAIDGLDVSDLVQDSSGSMAGKTLLTLSESDGKIGATFQDIAITSSQISDLTDSYTGTGTTAITDKSVKAAIDALDVTAITGDTSKTLTSISETDGKISATYSDIAIAESQVTNLTADLNGKADKVSDAVTGNFASLDANGNLADSGSKASDFKTKQTAVTDPTADGDAFAFIDSITQDENGEIVVTKKNVDKVEIVPTPDAADKLLTSDEGGTYGWRQLVKSAWGTVITDGENNLVDENGNAIMDENGVDLWTTFKGVGFGAERAAADIVGNSLTLTIESDRVTAIGNKPIGVGVEMTLAEVEQVVDRCKMPDYVPEI